MIAPFVPSNADYQTLVRLVQELSSQVRQLQEANLALRVDDLEAGGGGGGGGPTALDDLTDVVITTPASGEVLIYDGTQWVNDFYTSYFP